MSTTATRNKELVRQFVDDLWNEGNLDVIEETVADDYVGHDPESLGGETQGPEEFRAYCSASHAAFPDLELTIDDIIAEGNTVCRRSRLIGTHEGAFMGVEPTGNTVEVSAMVIYRIEDGQIAETWALADTMGMMEQLGIGGSPEA